MQQHNFPQKPWPPNVVALPAKDQEVVVVDNYAGLGSFEACDAEMLGMRGSDLFQSPGVAVG